MAPLTCISTLGCVRGSYEEPRTPAWCHIPLRWIEYGDSEGYENFGWWDLQGGRAPRQLTRGGAAELGLDPDSEEADEFVSEAFAECFGRY